ncbi:MAG: ABC transporter substrate-binding protein [Schaedlerella sp.]|nr:ABC transporter substrate-binding protein [Schaedlerella sp.]
MKKRNRLLLILMVLCLIMGMLIGCGSGSEGEKTETEKSNVGDVSKREITDMAGRTVEIPDEINKVFSVSTVSAIYIYTMNPDKLLGWNYELNDLEKEIILTEYHDLPAYGQGDSINYEAVIAEAPDILLNIASDDEAAIEEADRLSESTGIPVVIVSEDFEDTAKAYRFLGELFGEEERGEELAVYVEETFAAVRNTEIAEKDKATVYYGNGEQSLETAPSGSMHSEIIDFVNAVNIADVEAEGGSRIEISGEQLLAWNPDFILVNGEPKADFGGNEAAQSLMKDSNYTTLTAVQNEDVYGIPNTPFSWVDRPPGPNRVMGVRWLAGLLYPEYYDYDVREEATEFYKLFYHMELTEEQMTNLLGI